MADVIVTALFVGILAAVAGLVAATARAFRQWRGAWRVAALLPAALLAFWALLVVVHLVADPTSHNLWPLEILLVAGGGWLVLGTLWALRRLVQRRR